MNTLLDKAKEVGYFRTRRAVDEAIKKARAANMEATDASATWAGGLESACEVASEAWLTAFCKSLNQFLNEENAP